MILLVEDNEDDVFLMERAMRQAGITLPMQLAENGRDALDYLKGVGKFADRMAFPVPSVIFLDLKLPYVHGFEVLRWLKQESALGNIPVAVLSSSLEESDQVTADKLGAKAFLVKPPSPDILTSFFDSLPGLREPAG